MTAVANVGSGSLLEAESWPAEQVDLAYVITRSSHVVAPRSQFPLARIVSVWNISVGSDEPIDRTPSGYG